MTDSPKLLLEWSSPWREFVSAIGPALRPSPPRLHMEAHAGLFPARGMLSALLLEAAVITTVIALPATVFQPEAVEIKSSTQAHDVIYFSASELPRTQDLAGGSAGQRGAEGGTSLQHPSQTIKVARGEKLQAKVVDAPALHLPQSDAQISNLLAYKAEVPEPPPPKPPALTAPPILVHRSRERVRKLPEPEVVSAPAVKLPRNSLPNLPQADLTPTAPPPVTATIKVSRERARMTMSPPAAAPQVSAPREKMPELPEAGVAAKAPPTPIQVARSHSTRTRSDDTSAPAIDLRSRNPQLSSIVSSSAAGIPAAPPKPVAQPESKTVAVIVTPNPGPQQATPKDQEKTTVAMAPSGSAAIGSGGSGGGSGMHPGKGPGSAESGSNAGATSVGNDKGTDFYARNGNSPNLGPGGTGNLSSGAPRAPGVSVSGGKTSITLPSFGGPVSAAPAERSNARNMGNGITVVASPRAGGALNLYGALKGDRVYTIYINTKIGTAVMQFADPTSVGRAYTTELTAPRVLQAEVPSDLVTDGHRAKVLIACALDSNGVVRNAHLLRSDDSAFASKLLAAVPGWKFTAASRGNQSVAVEAILGFGVDTK